MEAIEHQNGEKEREREWIQEGEGLAKVDLADFPDEMGWPVASCDSGCSWGVLCRSLRAETMEIVFDWSAD